MNRLLDLQNWFRDTKTEVIITIFGLNVEKDFGADNQRPQKSDTFPKLTFLLFGILILFRHKFILTLVHYS